MGSLLLHIFLVQGKQVKPWACEWSRESPLFWLFMDDYVCVSLYIFTWAYEENTYTIQELHLGRVYRQVKNCARVAGCWKVGKTHVIGNNVFEILIKTTIFFQPSRPRCRCRVTCRSVLKISRFTISCMK